MGEKFPIETGGWTPSDDQKERLSNMRDAFIATEQVLLNNIRVGTENERYSGYIWNNLENAWKQAQEAVRRESVAKEYAANQ